MVKQEVKKRGQSRVKTMKETVHSLRGFPVETVQDFISRTIYTFKTPVVVIFFQRASVNRIMKL
jgi:hypothetical protein